MDWRCIFEQSRINGARYLGDELIQRVYKPVGDSWFQKRLALVRRQLKKGMLEGTERNDKEPWLDFTNKKT